MSYVDRVVKLSSRFEAVLKLAKEQEELESKKLLEAALKANKGHGIQIYFKGQHFGWYRWDPKKNKHEQFSIGNFDPKDTVGELENEVAKLTKIDLEDFLPVIAGRKQV